MSERNWIEVDERLPDHGKKVLAAYKNSYGKWRRIIGQYIYTKTELSTGENDEGIDEYDEDSDEYFMKGGWYECIENWGDYDSVTVSEGTVSHWAPLLEPPQEQGEEDA